MTKNYRYFFLRVTREFHSPTIEENFEITVPSVYVYINIDKISCIYSRGKKLERTIGIRRERCDKIYSTFIQRSLANIDVPLKRRSYVVRCG